MFPPSNKLYFENAAGRVEEDRMGFVRLTYAAGRREAKVWHGLLQHTRHLLARQGRGLLLVDQRRMQAYSLEEQSWLVGEWLPQTIVEAGYRYGAVLQAHDAFARLAMDTVRLNAQNLQLTYRYFQDEAEGIAWLQAQGAATVPRYNL